jgi:sulfur carrier protein
VGGANASANEPGADGSSSRGTAVAALGEASSLRKTAPRRLIWRNVAVDRAQAVRSPSHVLPSFVTVASTRMLSVTVNGEAHHCRTAAPTIADLLAELALTSRRIAVERNGEIVPRGAYGSTTLAAGDRLEIVVAVGGG